MRYTIEGFSQTEAIKFRRTEIVNGKEKVVTLDCTDLVILRWFVDFWPNMMKVEIGGRQYAWLSYKALIEDMPLIGIKKGMLALRLKKLVDFGILTHQTVKSGGTFSYYGFGPEYVRLLDTNHAKEVSDPAQHVSEGVPNKLDTPPQKISDQIDSSTKDPSTKDNQDIDPIPFSAIIDHLNEKTGRSYRLGKKTRELMEARFKEHYTIDDFKKVIDNMTARWKGTKFEQYLQPSTLFAQSHFDEYLNKPEYQPNQYEEDRRSQHTEQPKDDPIKQFYIDTPEGQKVLVVRQSVMAAYERDGQGMRFGEWARMTGAEYELREADDGQV